MLNNVTAWLEYLERPHSNVIKLDLRRIQEVASKLQVDKPTATVITVTGTNGKGSCVAMLEAVYSNAAYRVGAYTSPHLLIFNERVRINQQPVSDEQLCEAFATVSAASCETSLTYFEFVTVAALWIFAQQSLDVIILEVGIGGRLDATNIVSPQLAIISAIGIDHTDYLGTTREAIAFEKAGIMRQGQPVICGDPEPPSTISERARQLAAPLAICGKDFHYQQETTGWSFANDQIQYTSQLRPHLHLNNVATVIQAVFTLQQVLPVDTELLFECIANVTVPGRFQIITHNPCQVIIDVAHNPHAAHYLATRLATVIGNGKVHAVFSMLSDKDINNSIAPLRELITHWHIAELKTTRAASSTELKTALGYNGINAISEYATISDAFHGALKHVQAVDVIVVFGSFYTAAAVSLDFANGI